MRFLHHASRREAFLRYPRKCFSRSLLGANCNQNPQ